MAIEYRYISPATREGRVCFVIFESKDIDQNLTLTLKSELAKITQEYIKTHLYFFSHGTTDKIFYIQDPNLKIKIQEFDYVFFVRSGLLIKSEAALDIMLSRVTSSNESACGYYKEESEELLMGLCETQKVFLKNDVEFRELMCEPFANLEFGFFKNISFDSNDFLNLIPIDRKNVQTQISKAQQDLAEHFESIFESPFLFNTEMYTDVHRLPLDLDVDLICGASSGFKINYIINERANNAKHLTYFDINPKALELKKWMHKTWDGENLPHWIESKDIISTFHLSEKTIEKIRFLWKREMEIWGGSANFSKCWKKMCQMHINYVPLNLIEETISPLDVNPEMSTRKSILWISNIWNNEYVSYKYSQSVLIKKYEYWLQNLASNHPHAWILQSKIFFSKKPFYASALKVTDVLSQWNVFQGAKENIL